MKIDYKKQLKRLYTAPSTAVEVVDVPEMCFLLVDGAGDPNTSPEYRSAVEALFSVAYTLKFMVKRKAGGIDYAVMPLEGLWWTADMARFSVNRKDEWQWTLMIMQPEVVTAPLVAAAIARVTAKKGLAALPQPRFEVFSEGKAAQILHRGPFADEGPAIAKVHDFIALQGSQLRGKHHEIYLSDIRRAAPEKWRTILRQPMT